MTKVVLKAEIHTSRGDLQREKELLKQGFNRLMLEQSESEEYPNYSILDSWFSIASDLFFFILSHIYTSHQILKEIADIKGTEIIYTRESEKSVLMNNSFGLRTLCSGLFYLLFASSIIYGYYGGDRLLGAGILFIAVALPLLILRFGEMDQTGSKNRDKIMADKINQAYKNGESVLAVVGEKHIKGIEENLLDEIEPEIEEPVYSQYSVTHIKEVALPFFTAVSVLYTIYLVILWTSSQLIIYL